MLYDTDLDPFGDGSLLEVWTWNTDRVSNLGSSYPHGAISANGKYNNCVKISSWTTCSQGHGIFGDVAMTFMYWWYKGIGGGLSFGEDATRYNVQIKCDGSTMNLYLHKRGVYVQLPCTNPADGEWHLTTYTYDPVTRSNKVYLNKQYCGEVADFQMKFLGGNAIRLENYDYYDQWMTYTKTLSLEDISWLYDTMIPEPPPVPYTATPPVYDLLSFTLFDVTVTGTPIIQEITDVPTATLIGVDAYFAGTIIIPYTALPTKESIVFTLKTLKFFGSIFEEPYINIVEEFEITQEIISGQVVDEYQIIQEIKQDDNAIIIKRVY